MALDTIHQAGGGAGETQRVIETIKLILLPHLKKVYESVAGGPDRSWNRSQIQDFLSTVQKHGSHEDLATLLSKESLGFDEFLTYITSSHGAVTKERKNEDLSWPLASYFISSSHNTYLSGNQLSSDSTTDTYTNVLLRGCRCVEIDVWDGDDSDSESSSDDEKVSKDKSTEKKSKRQSAIGKIKGNIPGMASKLRRSTFGKNAGDSAAADHANKEPVQDAHSTSESKQSPPAPGVALIEPRVLHGYTLTKEISFRDVCKAIRDSAFVTTDLPLIVSLEVHCGPAQQLLMVEIMHEIWREYLVTEPETEPQVLPSPAELRNKILIKVKYAPPGSSPPANESDEDDRLSAEPDKKPSEKTKSKKPSKITQELSRLGIFTKGISFKSFTQPEASLPTHIFSLAEKKFLDFHEKQREVLCNHNRDYLVRAYPSGLRIRSSNLNPPVFWGAGGQIVALNWQQTDEGMMLNEGMFAGTGGYVLKPEGKQENIGPFLSPEKVSSDNLRGADMRVSFRLSTSVTDQAGSKHHHTETARSQHHLPRRPVHPPAGRRHPRLRVRALRQGRDPRRR